MKGVLICAQLLLLLCAVLSQKSFRLDVVSTDLHLGYSCVTQVNSVFTFNFLGYVYQRVGIPIRRDSLYRYSSFPSNFVKNLMVSSNATPVTQSEIVASDSTDPDSAYMILITFNPSSAPLNKVPFTISYNIDGHLTQDSRAVNNEATWSTKSGFADIADLSVRFHLSPGYNVSSTQITVSPLNYATTVTETLVEFKRAPLPSNQVFKAKVSFPLRVSQCVVPPASPLAIIIVVAAVVSVICVCIPICCCLGIISRFTRFTNNPFGATAYYNRGFNEPYTTLVYHNHHHPHGGYHGHSGSGSSHHGHSGNSGISNNRSSGSVFAA